MVRFIGGVRGAWTVAEPPTPMSSIVYCVVVILDPFSVAAILLSSPSSSPSSSSSSLSMSIKYSTLALKLLARPMCYFIYFNNYYYKFMKSIFIRIHLNVEHLLRRDRLNHCHCRWVKSKSGPCSVLGQMATVDDHVGIYFWVS